MSPAIFCFTKTRKKPDKSRKNTMLQTRLANLNHYYLTYYNYKNKQPEPNFLGEHAVKHTLFDY